MIFSDEPRFQKNAVAHPTNRQIHGFSKIETEKHVGPGVYFSTAEEDKRNGWKKNSFSTRQPMTPIKASSPSQDRQEYYTASVLTAYGAIAAPVSPQKRNNPGPGHYDGDIFSSFSPSPLKRAQSAESFASLRPGSANKNSAPRFHHAPSLCMKDGIIFQSKENSTPTAGPGHYPVARNDFLKKSHNIRVNKPSSPHKTQPITDVRQVFGTPGSTFKTPEKPRSISRPKSASATSPMNFVDGSGKSGRLFE